MEIENYSNDDVIIMSQGNKDFLHRNLPKVVGSDNIKYKFDPDRIIVSILKETSIKIDCPDRWSDVIDDITSEVCELIMELKIKKDYQEISARYIRELTCGALQKRNQKWREQYKTIGIPQSVFEKSYGHLYAEIDNIDELTPKEVYMKVISKATPPELIDLFYKMGKEFIGTINNIKALELEGK